MTRIPHDAWIAVADGAKALMLHNKGTPDEPRFGVLDVFRNPTGARTSEMGTDRPGRTNSSAGVRRSSMAQTDWHDIEEHRFARTFAQVLDRHCLAGDFTQLVVVAPARILAELRKDWSKRVQQAVIEEIDKDLTKHPVHEMERILSAD